MPDHAQTVAVIVGGTQGLGLAGAGRLVAQRCTRLTIAGRCAPEGEMASNGLPGRGKPTAMGMLVKPAHVAGLASCLFSSDSGVMTGALVDFDQNVAGACPE